MQSVTRTRLRELSDRHGIAPSRALGQNFVVEPGTIDQIVRLAGVGPGDRVVEIGAGVGSLTVGLVAAGARVVAVEIDRHLLPALREVLDGSGAEVVVADAMALDWASFLRERGDGPWSLVANLPYNIATPLVLDVVDRADDVQQLLVMVQKEVGERLAARPGSGAYGIPSVRVAFRAEASVVATVPPQVFVPRPRVASALVRITRRPQAVAQVDESVLWDLVRTAFGQRRKMLRRSLAGKVDDDIFDAVGIDPTDRPEQLDVATWCRLADRVAR